MACHMPKTEINDNPRNTHTTTKKNKEWKKREKREKESDTYKLTEEKEGNHEQKGTS